MATKSLSRLKRLKPNELTYLRKIGLSRNAIHLYDVLLLCGALSAREASSHAKNPVEAQYRLFYELENKQLVRRINGWPRRFEALPLTDGLQASLLQEEKELERLVKKLPANDSTHVIVGREAVYHAYSRYARKACDQISIYAIGIAYTDELAHTQAALIKRGVQVRHVVQEIKPDNFYVIDRWLKMGVEMRSLKRPRGYHITIIDKSCAIITFSDPQNTDQRVSIMTTEPHVIAIFQAQFESIWHRSRKIV